MANLVLPHPATLFALPPEIFALVTDLLEINDIFSLALANKSSWRELRRTCLKFLTVIAMITDWLAIDDIFSLALTSRSFYRGVSQHSLAVCD